MSDRISDCICRVLMTLSAASLFAGVMMAVVLPSSDDLAHEAEEDKIMAVHKVRAEAVRLGYAEWDPPPTPIPTGGVEYQTDSEIRWKTRAEICQEPQP